MGITARAKFFPAGLNVPAKPCDYCKSAVALLFCRPDAAFLCISCDAKTHHNNTNNNRHERVWMCEVCEQAPAAVTCKADAAALCVACDLDIHAANPLAGRHDRVPVVPFHDMIKPSKTETVDYECEPDPWSSMSPIHKLTMDHHNPDFRSLELLFQDSDQFLDFDQSQIPSQPYGDSVVPVQTTIRPPPVPVHHENRFTIDFSGSNISHSVSSSSMDVGVVPDGSSLSEISYAYINSSVDQSGNQQVVGMDREARVLRYREKKKNRKFEKTIRYASRKAYAETRPRIKGRFAKRTDADRNLGAGAASFVADARYGVVPSF